MKLCENLAINLKYYRKIYHLSKNGKVDALTSTIDKFAYNINKYDRRAKLKSEDLVIFDKSHITHFSRIDERKKLVSNLK